MISTDVNPSIIITFIAEWRVWYFKLETLNIYKNKILKSTYIILEFFNRNPVRNEYIAFTKESSTSLCQAFNIYVRVSNIVQSLFRCNQT